MSITHLIPILLISLSLSGQSIHKRPRILGIAHVGITTSDLGIARSFYRNLLGFDEPFSLKGHDGADWIAVVKINDQQYLELFAEPRKSSASLSHLALFTDDLVGVREYLASKGVRPVEDIHKGRNGDKFFAVRDPDGHLLEIVQYEPDSLTAQAKGSFMPVDHISNHITHVGIGVHALDTSRQFYRGLLGFQETMHRSGLGSQLDWVDMRVPYGTDFLELIPDQSTRMTSPEHFGLGVADVKAAVGRLQLRSRQYPMLRSIDVEVGDDQRWDVRIADPDGTLIELVETTGARQTTTGTVR